MRLVSLSFVAASTLPMAACVSNDAAIENSYMTRERQLAAECRERGGILTPIGIQTGRPETDNACKIAGTASRIERN